jgi:hypothetical protein
MTYGVDNYKIQLGLPALPDDNVPSELYDNFYQLHRAIQNLLRGVSQYCGIDANSSDIWSSLNYTDTLLESNLTRMYPIAGSAISRGQMVNLYNNAGVLNARPAQANSMSTMAHGIANSAAAAGNRIEMFWLRGLVDSIGSMTVGTLYYLHPTVAGAVQNAAPVTAGQIVQPVGLALAAATLNMDITLIPKQL